MDSMYSKVFRPILFQFDPESVHNLTIQALRFAGSSHSLSWAIRKVIAAHSINTPCVEAFGLTFSNPVGLAAGYDKDGLGWRGLQLLGFGHIEIGTITPKPQSGNPKPRVFRIPEEKALINRMGFPGSGAKEIAQRLTKSGIKQAGTIIGINIGKNKDTPNDEAAEDYLYLLGEFAEIADYLVINVSSPNTIGLRRLQAREFLEKLLSELKDGRAGLNKQPPILVKISPDLSDNELEDAVDAVLRTEMDGIIATNTTTSRSNLKSELGSELGGLSGEPLTEVSRGMVSKIQHMTDGVLPIIGVGGIMTPTHAKAMLDSGATLIQVYTGLVYAGPALVKEILRSL